MICSHCKTKVEDTGEFYPIGNVFVTLKTPYKEPNRFNVPGLCQGCQQNLKDEVLSVVEFYQKEKPPFRGSRK